MNVDDFWAQASVEKQEILRKHKRILMISSRQKSLILMIPGVWKYKNIRNHKES